MKILVDMNLSTQWVSFFVQNGHEAVHWSTIGRADAADEELFEDALSNDRILTNDLGFGLSDQAKVLIDGALVTVDPRRSRIRLLRLSEPDL